MHAIREFGTCVLAIVAITLGLLIIGVFFETAIEMADAWWQWPLGLGLALAVSSIALAILFAAVSATVGPTAVGWLGMFAGRVPKGYHQAGENRARAAADLVLFGLAMWLGIELFRHGAVTGNLSWSIEGLFLAGAGAVFGLLPAIPRLYFWNAAPGEPVRHLERRTWRRPRGQAAPDSNPGTDPDFGARAAKGIERVAVLVTLGLVGVGLSMCTANSVRTLQVRDGRAVLPYGDWVDGCMDPDRVLAECHSGPVELTLVPEAAQRLQLEVLTQCGFSVHTGAGDPIPGMARSPSSLGIRERLLFDPQPGRSYRVRVHSPKPSQTCTYHVRYLRQRSAQGERP